MTSQSERSGTARHAVGPAWYDPRRSTRTRRTRKNTSAMVVEEHGKLVSWGGARMSATANVETMTNGLVDYCADGGIATITMNDPPANTYTHEMMKDLDEAILKARFDDGVHVILLRGAGDKFFSAGANIKMLAT